MIYSFRPDRALLRSNDWPSRSERVYGPVRFDSQHLSPIGSPCTVLVVLNGVSQRNIFLQAIFPRPGQIRPNLWFLVGLVQTLNSEYPKSSGGKVFTWEVRTERNGATDGILRWPVGFLISCRRQKLGWDPSITGVTVRLVYRFIHNLERRE